MKAYVSFLVLLNKKLCWRKSWSPGGKINRFFKFCFVFFNASNVPTNTAKLFYVILLIIIAKGVILT